jgi:alpha-mannosidase
MYWGGREQSFSMRGELSVPASFTAPALYLPLGRVESDGIQHPEALLFIGGAAYIGIDKHHHAVTLPAALSDGRRHAFELRGWCGIQVETIRLGAPAIVDVDAATRAFHIAAQVAVQTVTLPAEHDPIRAQLLYALDAAFNQLAWDGPAFYASLAAAQSALDAALGEALPVTIVATGHAHIDVAWLRTLAQTRQKTARTFSTVLPLMEEFPDYHFTQSQPHRAPRVSPRQHRTVQLAGREKRPGRV